MVGGDSEDITVCDGDVILSRPSEGLDGQNMCI